MLRNTKQVILKCLSMKRNLMTTSDNTKVLWFDAKNSYEDVGVQSNESLLKHLLANKLFENEKIVIYNKPTGIRIHSEQNLANDLTIDGLLHILAQESKCVSLKVCEAPHDSYSGVMVLGKTDKVCKTIDEIFGCTRRKNLFLRKDIAVTWGVPWPSSGQVTIPVKEDEKQNLMPVFNPSRRQIRFNFVRKMRTLYRVLDVHKGAAVVELQPRDGVGQISLIHMTCKMCQVIGDKLYAKHIVNLRGIRMFADSPAADDTMLSWKIRKRLQMTSSEQYHKLPLLLHRYSVTLPAHPNLDLPEKLTVTAPLPDYFLTALQLLELKFENT